MTTTTARDGAANYAGGDEDFAAWLRKADAAARRRYGVSIFDLADYGWRDAYDDGTAPGEALRDAISSEFG